MSASAPPSKISLYNISELKSTTDDALAPYLTTLPSPYTFTQQHYYTNIRLALGYTAVTIAGLLFYVDWKLGWDVTKPYTLPACVAYFILNGALTYWIWGVEKGTIFQGSREGGQKLTLKSFTRKHDPTYRLRILYEAPSGQKWQDEEVEGKFTEWFSVQGYLQRKEFQKWLSKKIEVVGMADPVSERGAEKNYQAMINDTISNDTITVSSGSEVGTPLSPTKRGPGRPKKKA